MHWFAYGFSHLRPTFSVRVLSVYLCQMFQSSFLSLLISLCADVRLTPYSNIEFSATLRQKDSPRSRPQPPRQARTQASQLDLGTEPLPPEPAPGDNAPDAGDGNDDDDEVPATVQPPTDDLDEPVIRERKKKAKKKGKGDKGDSVVQEAVTLEELMRGYKNPHPEQVPAPVSDMPIELPVADIATRFGLFDVQYMFPFLSLSFPNVFFLNAYRGQCD